MFGRAGRLFAADISAIVFLFLLWFPFVYLQCTSWNPLVLFWSIYCFLLIKKAYSHMVYHGCIGLLTYLEGYKHIL